MGPRFLIVRATERRGRGVSGLTLARFLRVYAGSSAVRLVTVAELAAGPRRQAEILFIGLPTSLRAEHLAQVSFERAALFDYGDVAGPEWRASDERLLRSVSRIYLKPWVEPDWDHGLDWGALPLRRHGRLTLAVRALRTLMGRQYARRFRRVHDLAFLGYATAYHGTGERPPYPQRIEWLTEIRRTAPDLAFWGGIHVRQRDLARFQAAWPGLDPAILCPRAAFPRYFYHLLRSRLALAPAGNARWTYRHYEAIYAGSVPVSTDLRAVRTLIPLPAGVTHVPDGQPVVPAIRETLRALAADPHLPEANLEALERYLTDGAYDRAKPAVWDRFLDQLAPTGSGSRASAIGGAASG